MPNAPWSSKRSPCDDDPADRAGESPDAAVLGGSRLALPILGTRNRSPAWRRRTVRSFFRRHYRPSALAVTAAGNVDPQPLGEAGARGHNRSRLALGTAPVGLLRSVGPIGRGRGRVIELPWPGQCGGAGRPGLPRAHPIAGPWMCSTRSSAAGCRPGSSRRCARNGPGLFGVLGHAAYADAGVWSVSAGCQPDRAGEVADVITAELDRVVTGESPTMRWRAPRSPFPEASCCPAGTRLPHGLPRAGRSRHR